MNPEQPFYLLDDGTQPALSGPTMLGLSKGPMPPLFYAMLNKALALPLLADWAGYLWENGRLRSLITLLDEGKGQGYAAWRVLPTAKEWQKILETGLRRSEIQF
jgi:hypothetical protein